MRELQQSEGDDVTEGRRSRCPGHGRHWYTVHGAVGLRSDRCERCGEPNPRPLTEAQRRELTAYREEVQRAAGV